MAGLAPFSKKVLIAGIFSTADTYVAQMKKEGADGQPIAPKPLAITPEDRERLLADIKAQHL